MIKKALHFLGGLAFVILFPFIDFTISFLVISLVLQLVNVTLPIYPFVLLISYLGLFLGGLFGYIMSKKFDQEKKFFTPIIETLGQISRGDFSARLENKFRGNTIVSSLTESVNNMAAELNKMETMRQEFISNVSHEIQTPLTSIKGFAQALQSDQLNPTEQKHYLDIIEIESTRLSRIAENLLKLASLEAQSVKFEPKSYRLDKQIRRLVLACEPQWAGKEIEMEVALCEVEVKADEDLLSQVWMNLIHNSLKFTPQGGRICLELCRQDERIEFRIRDSGIGIAGEAQAHIFERFYKADKARTQSNGGSGLGLSIAYKIVEMHRGTITVASQPGEGATFQVCLPISQN
jgi:two-component system phosphate regulon sensor histidine kinase PhoR